jgi:hypothetical protein
MDTHQDESEEEEADEPVDKDVIVIKDAREIINRNKTYMTRSQRRAASARGNAMASQLNDQNDDDDEEDDEDFELEEEDEEETDESDEDENELLSDEEEDEEDESGEGGFSDQEADRVYRNETNVFQNRKSSQEKNRESVDESMDELNGKFMNIFLLFSPKD